MDLESNFEQLELESLEFREQVFEKPCNQVTELYKANQQYFDGLPADDIEFERNYLCKVKMVVKACQAYMSPANADEMDQVHDTFMQLQRQFDD